MNRMLLVLAFASASVYAQDPGIGFSQMSQQATQSAIQMQQQMIQTSNQMVQQMNDISSTYFPESYGPVVGTAAKPTFSVQSGKVSSDTTVIIKSATHYATIYFTTDGWTPNANSPHYTGPIHITQETHIQAIAIGPNMLRSPVARADYAIGSLQSGSPSADPARPLSLEDGILHAGTQLRLATSGQVSSKTAEVGDKVPLVLDQDVTAGGRIVAAKGSPVEATLTVADRSSKRGVPGDLVFEVGALDIQGKAVQLNGREILEGGDHREGENAEIVPNMIVPATVAADIKLTP